MPWDFPRLLAMPSRALAPSMAACLGVEGVLRELCGLLLGAVTMGCGIVTVGLAIVTPGKGWGSEPLAFPCLCSCLSWCCWCTPGANPAVGKRASTPCASSTGTACGVPDPAFSPTRLSVYSGALLPWLVRPSPGAGRGNASPLTIPTCPPSGSMYRLTLRSRPCSAKPAAHHRHTTGKPMAHQGKTRNVIPQTLNPKP